MEEKNITLNGKSTRMVKWPASKKKFKLVIVHGLGEHVGRYDAISKDFNDAGIEMIGFDQRGHGKNSTKKGHVDSFNLFLKDLKSFVEMEKDEFPLFMLGHSLGGLIAARYAEEYPNTINGLILSSGAFVSDNVPSILKFVVKITSVLFPTFTFSNGIDPHTLSRNEETVRKYTEDPLVHSKISARLASELFKNVQITFEKARSLSLPILFLAGENDKVVPPRGTKRLFLEVASKDKKLKVFKGAYHEIFCDPQHRTEFRKTIVDWIIDHAEDR